MLSRINRGLRFAAISGLFAVSPIVAQAQVKGDIVPDQYIITLKNPGDLLRLIELPINPADILQRYEAVFPGLAVRMPAFVAELVSKSPLVASVEPDRFMTVEGTQINPPWGLDRIDKAAPVYDSRYNYRLEGAGVHVYVVDSGLRRTHREFTGRVGNGFDAVGNGGAGGGSFIGIGGRGLFGSNRTRNDPPPATDPFDPASTPTDCNGHGTHVAGTIAGTTFGVAKKAIVHAVRVVNCQGVGTSSSAIAGLEWIMRNHVKPAVINMSLGGSGSATVDAATRAANEAGILVVAASGNDSTDACGSSPGREPVVINVSATERDDRRASYSNFGNCVDVFAPGSGVVSAGIRSDSDQTTKSGTSMASPHVAGAVAKLLSEGVSPANITTTLINRATRNAISDVRGSPNLMLLSD